VSRSFLDRHARLYDVEGKSDHSGPACRRLPWVPIQNNGEYGAFRFSTVRCTSIHTASSPSKQHSVVVEVKREIDKRANKKGQYATSKRQDELKLNELLACCRGVEGCELWARIHEFTCKVEHVIYENGLATRSQNGSGEGRQTKKLVFDPL
jgi:hypothetical protein